MDNRSISNRNPRPTGGNRRINYGLNKSCGLPPVETSDVHHEYEEKKDEPTTEHELPLLDQQKIKEFYENELAEKGRAKSASREELIFYDSDDDEEDTSSEGGSLEGSSHFLPVPPAVEVSKEPIEAWTVTEQKDGQSFRKRLGNVLRRVSKAFRVLFRRHRVQKL